MSGGKEHSGCQISLLLTAPIPLALPSGATNLRYVGFYFLKITRKTNSPAEMSTRHVPRKGSVCQIGLRNLFRKAWGILLSLIYKLHVYRTHRCLFNYYLPMWSFYHAPFCVYLVTSNGIIPENTPQYNNTCATFYL